MRKLLRQLKFEAAVRDGSRDHVLVVHDHFDGSRLIWMTERVLAPIRIEINWRWISTS